QSENSITASGNIEYTLEEKGMIEVFTGESLTFNVDTWEGLFFNGTTETERKIEEKNINFYFSGNIINRSAKNIITLNDGMITSCNDAEPHYRIQAKKIWVLAPGEWGLQDALFYVGQIPVFYLPFFFHSGDELFFHPAIGSKDKEGYFFQTTSYIIGRKPKKESTISFLQIGEENENYNEKLRGLFLKKYEDMTDEERKMLELVKKSNIYLKILFDLYTRLGLFWGVEANIVDADIIDHLTFSLGFARSRSIFIDPIRNSFTPYWKSNDGTMISYWNVIDPGGRMFPLRYGLSTDFALKADFFSLSSSLARYSEPFFERDFGNRKEDIDWGELFRVKKGDEEAADQGSEEAQIKNRLNWTLRGSLYPNMEILKPYITAARISDFEISMYWKNKEMPLALVPGMDQNSGGYVPESSRTDFSFPERKFYYPESYLFPQVSGHLSGSLFSLPAEAKAIREKSEYKKEEEPGKGLKPPWEEPERDTEKQKEETTALRKPDLRTDIPLVSETKKVPYSQKLSYTILPNLTVDNKLNSSAWERPKDIDFSKSYSILDTHGTTSLEYSAKLYENLLIISNLTTLSLEYKKHFNKSESVADLWSDYLKQDYTSSFLKIGNAINLTSFPVYSLDLIKTSTVKYSFTSILLNRKYMYTDADNTPVYENLLFKWEKDFVSTHSFGLTLNLKTGDWLQSLEFTALLPPLDREMSSTLGLQFGPLSSKANGKLMFESDKWVLKPFTIEEILTLFPKNYMDQTFIYDFEQKKWINSKSILNVSFLDNNISFRETFNFGYPPGLKPAAESVPLFQNPTSSLAALKLWWFEAGLLAEKTKTYAFIPVTGWEESGEAAFRVESMYFGVNFNFDSNLLWKNRVKLSTDINSKWSINVLKFSDSYLDFKLAFKLAVYKFLDLQFSMNSENKNTFRYFKAFSDRIDQEPINPLTDLLKSFNVFNIDDRKASYFKAKNISLRAIHHLHDWDLTFEYIGKPELKTDAEGYKYYEWIPEISIFVKWNPIPEIQSKIRTDTKTITY
ncbi:MAG: hypothetical protein AB1798_17920, partial [Spirochaetota bacterium]